MFFLLLVFTECGQLNPHALLSGSGLIISVCYLLCWLLGYRGIIFMNYILVFVIWLMLFSSVSYLNFKFIGDMRIVKGAFHYSIVCLIAAELYLGSVVNMTMRIISIYIAGVYIAWVLTTCKDFNFKWYMLQLFNKWKITTCIQKFWQLYYFYFFVHHSILKIFKSKLLKLYFITSVPDSLNKPFPYSYMYPYALFRIR